MAAAICSSRYMLLEDMPSGPHNGCAWRLIPAHQSRAVQWMDWVLAYMST